MGRGVLFVHNNFPAQFGDLARTLSGRGVPCAAIGAHTALGVDGVPIARYQVPRGTGADVFPLAIRAEADLIRGRAAFDAAQALRQRGFEPEAIIGHSGWGETVFLSDVFPEAKQVLYPEFFYHGRGSDIDFDQALWSGDEESLLRGRAKNAVMTLALTDADAIVTPTAFQGSRLPDVFHPRLRVIHEGVDVEAIRPAPAELFALPDGRAIAPGAPVVTHINNQMEPMRGLHIFLRALPRLFADVPNVQVVVIGEEKTSGYGAQAPGGRTWKQVFLEEIAGQIDLSRVHFLGRVEHARMLAALRLSTAHVYYTYPFVLSWSLIEAMACGAYVVGSDTAPVRDAIEDGVNGRLLPFFDADALAQTLIAACRDPDAAAPLRAAARKTAVERFSRTLGRSQWIALLERLGVRTTG